MKLIDKDNMSYWAYIQCIEGNDNEEMRDLIVHPWYAYLYCKFIDNREDMREKVNVKEWRFEYNLLCKK